MSVGTTSPSSTQDSPATVNFRIFSAVLLTFTCYLSIGIPLGVLPGYIHADLGYSSFIAGLGISMQYIARMRDAAPTASAPKKPCNEDC
jgi:ribose/xylose/arabinose/galactoside ABC-type transport system permease subunit